MKKKMSKRIKLENERLRDTLRCRDRLMGRLIETPNISPREYDRRKLEAWNMAADLGIDSKMKGMRFLDELEPSEEQKIKDDAYFKGYQEGKKAGMEKVSELIRDIINFM